MVKIYRHKIIFEKYKFSLACIHFNLLTKWYLEHSSTLKHKNHQNPCFIFIKIKKIKVSILSYTLLANCLQSPVIVTRYSKSEIRPCSWPRKIISSSTFPIFHFSFTNKGYFSISKKKDIKLFNIFPNQPIRNTFFFRVENECISKTYKKDIGFCTFCFIVKWKRRF